MVVRTNCALCMSPRFTGRRLCAKHLGEYTAATMIHDWDTIKQMQAAIRHTMERKHNQKRQRKIIK